jgi:hypothetical protein
VRALAFSHISQPPKRVPTVGQILRLRPGDWKYDNRPLRLYVQRVRTEISMCYDGDWVWVEGYELDDSGATVTRIQALVRVAALDAPPQPPT